jgi:hypothetical protein
MKKKIIYLLLTVGAGTMYAQNSYYIEKTSFSTPIQYNDYLTELIDLVDDQWTIAIEDSIMESALSNSKKMNDMSDKVLKTLDKIQPYDGEVDFKKSAKAYVEHMFRISKKELPEFIRLIRDPDKFTPAMEKRAEELIPILDGKREILFQGVERSQQAFSRKYGFTVK